MRVNGVEICVDTTGRPGDPAVLLIAGASSAMDWWPSGFVDRLAAAGRYVIRYDTRDTGRSESYPPGAPGYGFADLVADAVGVLDALGVNSAQLVGVSMGGALAQLVAAGHPGRVDSLVLIATSPAAPSASDLPGMSDDLREFFQTRPQPDYADRDAMIAHAVAVLRRFEGPEFFDEAQVRATAGRVFDRTRDMAASERNHMLMPQDDAAPVDLGDLDVPTLVVHGTVDPLFPIAHGEALVRAIPGATLLPLDGVGHQPPPAATWDVVVPRMLALGRDG